MKKKQIKVITMEVGQDPKVLMIDNKYEVFKELVNGYIETIDLDYENPCEYIIVLNEEGKLIPLKPNFHFYDDVIFGNIFVTGVNDDGDFSGVKDKDVDMILERLKSLKKADLNENPEKYCRIAFFCE